MMRTLLVGLTTIAILSGFAACGKPAVPCEPDALTQNPQVCPDRDSLGFRREFGSGTLIGQKPQESLIIRNGGLTDLNVTSVNISGDPAFTMTTEPATLPTAVKGNKYFYIRVIFDPREARLYTGSITMASNAENSPSKTFEISGCGIPADGGTSPCYRDGGM
ncbi:MAG: hypothetical protein JNM17_08435 [Archangium sp.]|nr:hypothetical protein [Archangium sp.]